MNTNILFTGNLAPISNRFFEQISDYHCVVHPDNEEPLEYTAKNVRNTKTPEKNAEDESYLFQTFDFETVVFFSHTCDGEVKVFDELQRLEQNLYLARRNGVKKVVYIVSNDIRDSRDPRGIRKADAVSTPGTTSRTVLIRACENLCRQMTENNEMEIVVLRIPYLYSKEEAKNRLHEWINEACTERKITMRGAPVLQTDFLCDEDLAVLIQRILDEPVKASLKTYNLSGDNPETLKSVAEMIAAHFAGTTITYGNLNNAVPVYEKTGDVRRDFGWFPMHLLDADLPELLEEAQRGQAKKKSIFRRSRRRRRLREYLRIALELIISFLAAVYLNYIVRDNVLLNFLDFRLVFVVLMGSLNGLNAGVVAAILASAGYLYRMDDSTSWTVIFYNIENWLPFAVYFMLGAVCGYTRDRHEDEVEFARNEQEVLEKKYHFLFDMYGEVLENKKAYNNQIIGFRDSYGKLYSVLKNLDKLSADEILFEAVNALEDLLGNTTVAIYFIENHRDFARLTVCSALLNNHLAKSLDLRKQPELLECLKKNELYVNRDNREGAAYAVPIYRDGTPVACIMLLHASEDEMNLEFSNKFRIISKLIEEALVRAYRFEAVNNDFVDGTMILKADKFEETYRIKQKMSDKQYSDYALLRIEQGILSLEEMSHKLATLIRGNDVLGLQSDGGLYLLLNQIRQEELPIVEGRLRRHEVRFEVM